MDLIDKKDLPIGVFDSGLGGLTVVREIRRLLPTETILYLGDSARVPYGTRSSATIERYAANCAKFLLDRGLKLLVVACNTVSATALPTLRKMTDIPVLGVISAGARAVSARAVSRVGVIGTESTIASSAYPEHIRSLCPECSVFSRPTPLFVPLAEEGWILGTVPEAAALHYLTPLVQQDIELLLLGCTHYPVLKQPIAQALHTLGSSAEILDSATVMALDVANALRDGQMESGRSTRSPLTCFVTDLPTSFKAVAVRFLGENPDEVRLVDII